jgi:hypothetical protein
MTPIPDTTPQPSSMRTATGGGLEPRPPGPSFGARVLGWTLLTMSLGLVSCQSMFVL